MSIHDVNSERNEGNVAMMEQCIYYTFIELYWVPWRFSVIGVRDMIATCYWQCFEPDAQLLSLDRKRHPCSLAVRPRDLNRLFANFQSWLHVITVIATEPTSMASDIGSETGGKFVRYVENILKETKTTETKWISKVEAKQTPLRGVKSVFHFFIFDPWPFSNGTFMLQISNADNVLQCTLGCG